MHVSACTNKINMLSYINFYPDMPNKKYIKLWLIYVLD